MKKQNIQKQILGHNWQIFFPILHEVVSSCEETFPVLCMSFVM